MTSPPRILFWLVIACGLVGCDERDRTNPLDPRNGETGGEPDWLVARGANERVELSWQTPPRRGFDRFELSRSVGADSFSVVHVTEDPRAISFVDSGRVNGIDIAYRLDLVVGDEQRVSLPEKRAMPGAAVPWVCEAAGFGVVRMTPDARHVVTRTGGAGGPFDAAVDPDGESIWVADYFTGEVAWYAASGARRARFGVSLPFRLAVDWSRERVWVGSWRIGENPTLYAFDFEGRELDRFTLHQEVRDLAVDEASGACYAAMGRGGGIGLASVDDTLRVSEDAGTYMFLVVGSGAAVIGGDPLAGVVRGFHLATLDSIGETTEIESPQAMTLGPGGLWVVDGSERIVCVDLSWRVTRAFDGVGAAVSIAVDPESGALWLAVPLAGRVVRLDVETLATRHRSLFQPFLVTIGRSPDTLASARRSPAALARGWARPVDTPSTPD